MKNNFKDLHCWQTYKSHLCPIETITIEKSLSNKFVFFNVWHEVVSRQFLLNN